MDPRCVPVHTAYAAAMAILGAMGSPGVHMLVAIEDIAGIERSEPCYSVCGRVCFCLGCYVDCNMVGVV
jgi:hypothetical protein